MPCLLKPLLVDGHDKVTELKKKNSFANKHIMVSSFCKKAGLKENFLSIYRLDRMRPL
jgi:hypothetical protein